MVYVYPNKLKIRSHDANQDKVSIFFLGGGVEMYWYYVNQMVLH